MLLRRPTLRFAPAEDVTDDVTQTPPHGLLLVVGDAVGECDDSLSEEAVYVVEREKDTTQQHDRLDYMLN